MEGTFEPGPGRERALRDALGRFATGVTVVTCDGADGPVGITANSFSSLSLDPPLVLWSPARSSRRFEAFAAASHFAVHVLAEEQADLCLGFSMAGDAWDDVSGERNPEGVHVIHGCLARFDCALHARHDGGDHEIHVGRVLRVHTRPGEPLVFSAGSYGRFTTAA